MKTLQELLQHEMQLMELPKAIREIEVSGLALDSREVKEGFLFFAITGTQTDGHEYIAKAIEAGAVAIIAERELMTFGVPLIVVANSADTLGRVASIWYNQPSTKLKLVGVTGTNGKTTVASLLHQLFTKLGFQCGLISTVQNIIVDRKIPSTHTTPHAIQLNQLMAEMVNHGCDYCFMEVSSHAAHQRRIAGLNFQVAIFTNITHDHLDYHGTFANYLAAKKSFFDQLPFNAMAITNKDDKNGMVMLQNTKATKFTYALKQNADFKSKIVEQDFNGMLLQINGLSAWFRLTGEFNAYNLTAVYGASVLLGVEENEVFQSMSALTPVEGRFMHFKSLLGVVGVVDYAHTPDALENVLEVIRQVRTGNEQLICVFGCGGDRDKAKRPLMAEVACRLADKVILTSDNPRTESPELILDDIAKGIPAQHFKKTLRIQDRKEAIKMAVSFAQKGDIILVAGKGHEHYQEINGIKHPFNDAEILTEFFNLFQN